MGVTLNTKADGFNGIWYMNQRTDDEYVYKYSGGLGTYCAKHKPLAIYCASVNKTFFCYGGARRDYSEWPELSEQGFDREDIPNALFHSISYFDHETGQVARPTILLDKRTTDAHDNPVIAVDDDGHIWIFSTSHGTGRPSYIHKSTRPFDIDKFELINPTRIEDGKPVPFDNFSYMQIQHVSGQGFVAFLTRYYNPVFRTIGFITSTDGVTWSEWQRLAHIDEGHYQVSAVHESTAGTAFNRHPMELGCNYRTDLYYLQTRDWGKTWETVDGKPIDIPLAEKHNAALVHDYHAEGLNVYMKDMVFDTEGCPILLYITSRGFEPGPENAPRTWRTARWTGSDWEIRTITESDSNYDMGSLFIEKDGTWCLVGPTGDGPQPFNPGGEMAMWESSDEGAIWTKTKALTTNSERNHSYARRPVNAHPDFIALWADGHCRAPSISNLYFCSAKGEVRVLPPEMKHDLESPPII